MWADLEFDWEQQEGLVAVGGDLSPERLVSAYELGLFPWFGEDMPICWWCPDPRAIIPLDGLKVSRRLARTCRSGRFTCTLDRCFAEVMRACGENREDGTWITEEMIAAYCRLHELGIAHSIETWHDGELVGGVYGVALGGLFAGESMFHRMTDASKVALARLFEHLRRQGYTLFDTQLVTPHTARMGAILIPRQEYFARLRSALACPAQFGTELAEPDAVIPPSTSS